MRCLVLWRAGDVISTSFALAQTSRWAWPQLAEGAIGQTGPRLEGQHARFGSAARAV